MVTYLATSVFRALSSISVLALALNCGLVSNASAQSTDVGAICDAARTAQARRNPAAEGLQRRCDALLSGRGELSSRDIQQLNLTATELAARGERIAQTDPRLLAMDRLYVDRGAGRGFHAGLAAAEGQTEDGPGKQRLARVFGSGVAPDGIDNSGGYRAAVSYMLDLNRNTERAAIGASVADRDAEVEAARSARVDGRFKLGFDIATAIFGDPTQGAQGNTALGPGSRALFDSLSDEAKVGFDAGLRFHLAKSYPR